MHKGARRSWRRQKMKASKFLMTGLLISALSATAAMAEINAPTSVVENLEYLNLRAVELSPLKSPVIQEGQSRLNNREERYAERLPLQLRGAMEKVKSRKYRPGIRTIKF